MDFQPLTLLRRHNPQGMFLPGVSSDSGEQFAITFDAILLESPSFESKPTENVVENGAIVSDHVTQVPFKGSFRCVISNTPVSIVKSFSNLINDENPVESALKLLEEFVDRREPFDMVTDMRTYKNVVISKFTPRRDTQTGSTLDFTLDVQQIIIVESVQVQVPKGIVRGSSYSAASEQEGGKQAADPTNPAEEDKGSILYQRFAPVWKDMGITF